MSGRKHLPKAASLPVGSGKKASEENLRNITFPPCDHLKRLLQSQAKDSVLRNYNLAIKISCLAYPKPSVVRSRRSKTGKGGSNRNEDGKQLDFSTSYRVAKKSMPEAPLQDHKKLLKLRGCSVKCGACHNNLLVNLICIQCPNVGCFDLQHATKHSAQLNHLFAVSTFGEVYCFRCKDYVSDPQLEANRIESLKLFDRLSSAPGMPVYSFLEPPKNTALLTDIKLSDSTALKEFIEANSRLPSFKASTGLRGFVNMGATCYMSVILQTLIHNPYVRDYFLSGDHVKCIKKLTETDDSCITCRIDEIFTEFYTSNSISGFGLTQFLTTAWKVNKTLTGYTQQDAHEFWQFVLGEFHKSHTLTMMGNQSVPQVKNHTRSSSISLGSNDRCDCITHKIFNGELQSTIKCEECNNINKTVDPMIDILLQIKNKDKNHHDLVECLEWFTKPEHLGNDYNCTFCQKKTSASKKLSIKHLGPVLTIQLKVCLLHFIVHHCVRLEFDILTIFYF